MSTFSQLGVKKQYIQGLKELGIKHKKQLSTELLDSSDNQELL